MGTPQVARFGDFLRKVFSIKGPVDTEVVYDVQPQVDLGQWEKAELLGLADEDLWSVGAQFSGGVGTQAQITIQQRKQGYVTIVEGIVAGGNTAGTIFLNLQQTFNGAGLGTTVLGDLRAWKAGAGVAATEFASNAVAVTLGGAGAFVYNAGVSIYVPCRFVLTGPYKDNGAGSQLNIATNVPNSALTVMAWGRERLTEPSESF
jgi:hypothetical protein